MQSFLVAGDSGLRRKANPEWSGNVMEGLLKRRTPEFSLRVKGVIRVEMVGRYSGKKE